MDNLVIEYTYILWNDQYSMTSYYPATYKVLQYHQFHSWHIMSHNVINDSFILDLKVYTS